MSRTPPISTTSAHGMASITTRWRAIVRLLLGRLPSLISPSGDGGNDNQPKNPATGNDVGRSSGGTSPLIAHVARDNRRLADQPARAEEQHQHQEQADQDHLDRGALGGAAGRHQLGDEDAGASPDGPDHQRAEQGAAVIAAAADD